MKFKKLDYIIVASLVLVSCVLIFKPEEVSAKRLILMHEDKEIVLPFKNQSIDLSKEFKDMYYDTQFIDVPILMEITDEQVRFIEADCPDHLCIGMGWAKNCGDMVICMPNATAVMVDCRGALDAK